MGRAGRAGGSSSFRASGGSHSFQVQAGLGHPTGWAAVLPAEAVQGFPVRAEAALGGLQDQHLRLDRRPLYPQDVQCRRLHCAGRRTIRLCVLGRSLSITTIAGAIMPHRPRRRAVPLSSHSASSKQVESS